MELNKFIIIILISFEYQRDHVRFSETQCLLNFIELKVILKDIRNRFTHLLSLVVINPHGITSNLRHGDSMVNIGSDVCYAFSQYFKTIFFNRLIFFSGLHIQLGYHI